MFPSDEELNEAIMKKMYELMDEKMNNPTYGDKTTVTVNVKVDKDGAYYIPQKRSYSSRRCTFPGRFTLKSNILLNNNLITQVLGIDILRTCVVLYTKILE